MDELRDHLHDERDPSAPATEPVTNGPLALAAGGVALLEVDDDALDDLAEVRVGDEVLDAADGESVQLVVVPPALDNPPLGEGGAAAPISVNARGLPTAGEALLDKQVASPFATGQRRLAVRIPGGLQPGPQDLVLATTSGRRLSWPFLVVDDSDGFVPPAPRGILFPSVDSIAEVFPIGTSGTFGTLVDGPLDFTFRYNLGLRETPDVLCTTIVGPRRGVIVGDENVGGFRHELTGVYDLDNANVAEITIDRTPSGFPPETYRGGWITGSIPEPAERGQLSPPEVGASFLALRSLATGRQLVIEHSTRDISFEEACPSAASN